MTELEFDEMKTTLAMAIADGDDVNPRMAVLLIDECVRREREECARIVDPPRSEPCTPEALIASTVRKMLAEAIRSRSTTHDNG